MRWPGDGRGGSLWSELLAWTLAVVGLTAALYWRTRDSIGLIVFIAFLPVLVVSWAVGWGLIVIAMSHRLGRTERAPRCPACGEPVTPTQQACSWCGQPLLDEPGSGFSGAREPP